MSTHTATRVCGSAPHTRAATASGAWRGGGQRPLMLSPTSQRANEPPGAEQLFHGARRPPSGVARRLFCLLRCVWERSEERACPPQTPCVDGKRNCPSPQSLPCPGGGGGAKGASWLTPVPVTPRRWVSLRGASGGPHILQMRGGLSALPGRKAAPGWLQSEVARPGDKARRRSLAVGDAQRGDATWGRAGGSPPPGGS